MLSWQVGRTDATLYDAAQCVGISGARPALTHRSNVL